MNEQIHSQDQILSQVMAGHNSQETPQTNPNNLEPSTCNRCGGRNEKKRNNAEKKATERWVKNTLICEFYKQGSCNLGQKWKNPRAKFCKKFMTNVSQKGK